MPRQLFLSFSPERRRLLVVDVAADVRTKNCAVGAGANKIVVSIEELREGLGRFGVNGRLRLRIEQLPVDLATGP